VEGTYTKNRFKRNMNLKTLGILLVLPAFLFITITMIAPILWNAYLSFTSWDGNSKIKAAGFNNYINIFKDHVTLLGFYHSIFIAIISSLIAVISGLFLALMINKMNKKEGGFFRFIFFMPSMIPFTVIGFLFVFILSPEIGLLNNILRLLGLGSLQHAWLSEPGTVIWSIAIIGGWRFTGVVMMLCYTAIITLPVSMFEAARIEGAGYIKQIQIIIIPLIMPTIRLSILLLLMWSFKTYDIVWAMTKGGPGDLSTTVPVRMLDIAFRYNQFGYASAIGVLLTILVTITILIAQKMTRRTVYEY
jgi:raffinose/stachyose/melibiose transport system permease protein